MNSLFKSEHLLDEAISGQQPLRLNPSNAQLDRMLKDPSERITDLHDEFGLRGDVIRHIILDHLRVGNLECSAVIIEGAIVIDRLHLSLINIPAVVKFKDCRIVEHLALDYLRASTLILENTRCGRITARHSHIAGSVHFKGLIVDRGIALSGSHIGGQLTYSGAAMPNTDGNALVMDNIFVTADLALGPNLKMTGALGMISARIGGTVFCHSLDLHASATESDVGTEPHRPSKAPVFQANNIETGGNFILRRLDAHGDVTFHNARVGKNLEVTGSVDGSLNFAGARVADFALFNGLDCKGQLNGRACHVAADMQIAQATLRHPLGCLDLSGARIDGSLNLSKTKAMGAVNLVLARIRGQFSARRATFIASEVLTPSSCSNVENEGDLGRGAGGMEAIVADGCQVGGGFALEDGKVRGEVRLVGAKIGGPFSLKGGCLENPGGLAFHAEGAEFAGGLLLNGLRASIKGKVNLASATTTWLADAVETWPVEQKSLYLNGFRYEYFSDANFMDTRDRLRWLKKLHKFSALPYHHLAGVLRNMGHTRGAEDVIIAKEQLLREHGNLAWRSKVWNWVLDVFVGYGYRWRWLLVFANVVIIVGAILFGWAFHVGLMERTVGTPWHRGVPVGAGWWLTDWLHYGAYSLDVFLPIVDLGQATAWVPNRSNSSGFWMTVWMWVESLLGWVTITILGGALAGLQRRE